MKINTNECTWFWSDLWEEVTIRNPTTGGSFKGEFTAYDSELIYDGKGLREDMPTDIRFVSRDVEFKLDELRGWEYDRTSDN